MSDAYSLTLAALRAHAAGTFLTWSPFQIARLRQAAREDRAGYARAVRAFTREREAGSDAIDTLEARCDRMSAEQLEAAVSDLSLEAARCKLEAAKAAMRKDGSATAAEVRVGEALLALVTIRRAADRRDRELRMLR